MLSSDALNPWATPSEAALLNLFTAKNSASSGTSTFEHVFAAFVTANDAPVSALESTASADAPNGSAAASGALQNTAPDAQPDAGQARAITVNNSGGQPGKPYTNGTNGNGFNRARPQRRDQAVVPPGAAATIAVDGSDATTPLSAAARSSAPEVNQTPQAISQPPVPIADPSSSAASVPSVNVMAGAPVAFAARITAAGRANPAGETAASAKAKASADPETSAQQDAAATFADTLSQPVDAQPNILLAASGSVASQNAALTGQTNLSLSAAPSADTGRNSSADLAVWTEPGGGNPGQSQPFSQADRPAFGTASVAAIESYEAPDSAGPVKNVQVQLAGSGDQRVELRLVEHAGGLSVSVRSSDNDLTRGLREQLPELSARLAAGHYESETWVPAAAPVSATSEQNQHDSTRDQSGQDTPGQSGSGEQPGGGQQRNPQRQPVWYEDLLAFSNSGSQAVSYTPSEALQK